MEAMTLIDALRVAAGALVAGAGLVLVAGGAVGLLRFPDVYTRAHAVLSSDGAGAAVVAAGLAIIAWDWAISFRLAILAALLAALGPVCAHFVANAAHTGGLAPISGRYVAPRGETRGMRP
jgi:multicomponent Na+:H+ antiporter subunit G